MANRYWVGGAGTWDATTTTHWSASSGGASGASVPTASDSVFFDQAGTYTVTVAAANVCLDFNVTAGTVTFTGGTGITISGGMSLIASTVVGNGLGAITFNSSATTNTITTNGVSLNSGGNFLIFNGTGKWTLGSALTCGTRIVFTNGTFDTSASNYAVTATRSDLSGGTVNLNGSTVTFSTNVFNYTAGTLNAGTSTVVCSSTSFSVNGPLTYYNLSFTASASGTFTGANTYNNLSFTGNTSTGIGTIQIGANQTINGTLTVSAGLNATARTFILSGTIGTTRTLTCAAVSLTDTDFEDITIAGAAAPASGTRLGDCKGNSGITFPAGVNKYWNLAAGGNWASTGWATTGGGTPAVNNFPLAQDTAIFQSTGLNSAATVTINANYNIGTIDMSARTANTMTLATGSTNPTIYGNWINGTGTTISGTSLINFSGRGTQTLTSAGVTFTQNITLNSPSGTLQLQDALTTSVAAPGAFTLTNGTLDLNGKTLTLSASATATFTTAIGTKNITFNGGTIVIAASGTTAFNNLNPTGFTTTAGTGTGTISMTSASAKTFVGSGSTFNCTLNQGGAGALTITGSNTFNNISNTYSATGATTITFTSGTTTILSQFTATGTVGKVLTIGATTTSQATLQKPSTWYMGANSTNGGNNTGLTFTAGGGIDYLSVSYINGTVVSTANTSNFFQFFPM